MTDSNQNNITVYSKQVLTPHGLREASIIIINGKITDIKQGKPDCKNFVDLENYVIMPGLIDSHVHINEPGRTEWEGFETITKAAIAGGITTLVDMPLNSTPVTTKKENLQLKINASEGNLFCNCGFWGGIVPENSSDLDDLLNSGVLGIKAFLTHSGIDDFPNVTEADIIKAIPALLKHNLPLLAHAEFDDIHEGIEHFEKNPTSYQAFLKSRPNYWEDKAIRFLLSLCEKHNIKTHIVHLSSANCLPEIIALRKKRAPLSIETCPQYLYFNSENIPDANTLFKCTPPIREKANNDRLWDALINGDIDFVVSDHSPATPELKKIDSGNLKEAWGGIASVQFSLPVVWTAAKKRNCSIEQVSKWMSTNVAKFIGLENQKGKIEVGFDADIVVWDPSESFIVDQNEILYKHQISPYVGEKLFGVIKQTYLKGVKVFDDVVLNQLPFGEIITSDM